MVLGYPCERNIWALPRGPWTTHWSNSLSQAGAIWEKEPQLRNGLHQTGLKDNLWPFSWLMIDVWRLNPLWVVLPVGRQLWVVQGSRLSEPWEQASKPCLSKVSAPALPPGSRRVSVLTRLNSGWWSPRVSQINPLHSKLSWPWCFHHSHRKQTMTIPNVDF